MPNHEQERLTESEYEELYSDALRILSYEYDSVGLPHRNNTGKRICRIESLHANDRTVFLLAFGSDVADSIEQSKPPMVHFTLGHYAESELPLSRSNWPEGFLGFPLMDEYEQRPVVKGRAIGRSAHAD